MCQGPSRGNVARVSPRDFIVHWVLGNADRIFVFVASVFVYRMRRIPAEKYRAWALRWPRLNKAYALGRSLAADVVKARRVWNTPPEDCLPAPLAEVAKAIQPVAAKYRSPRVPPAEMARRDTLPMPAPPENES